MWRGEVVGNRTGLEVTGLRREGVNQRDSSKYEKGAGVKKIKGLIVNFKHDKEKREVGRVWSQHKREQGGTKQTRGFYETKRSLDMK